MAQTIQFNSKTYVLCDLKKDFSFQQTIKILSLLQSGDGSPSSSLIQGIANCVAQGDEMNVTLTKFFLLNASNFAALCSDKNLKTIFLVLFQPEGETYTKEYEANLETTADALPPIPLDALIVGIRSFFSGETIANDGSNTGSPAGAESPTT